MKKLILLCSLLFALFSNAQIPTNVTDKLNNTFDSLCAKYAVKGSSAAIYVPDWGMWKRTWGISYEGNPINENMLFLIGSNTKTYVSTIILRLHQDGLLNIDDTIGKWIIDVPNISGSITIRQLLQHTSGLANYTADSALTVRVMTNDSTKMTPEEILTYVREPIFAPGTSWGYCNTNYVLAGLIIKKVLNKSLAEAFHQYIFTPLNLTITVFGSEETTNLEIAHRWTTRLGTGYMIDWDASGRSYNALISEAWAAGGMYATAEDNALFFDGLFNRKSLIADSMLAQMCNTKSVASNTGYGLGIFSILSYNNRKIFSHGGTFLGTINENVYDPVNKCVLTMLSNQDSISNAILSKKILWYLHKDLITVKAGLDQGPNADLNVQVYPNPSNGEMSIDLEEFSHATEFTLYDYLGKKLFTQKIDEHHTELKTEQAPGLYFYTIQSTDGRSKTGRLLFTK